MHPATKNIIELVNTIEGYSANILLDDLLAECFQLVTLDEAATVVSVARRTIERWISSKSLKAYRKESNTRVNKYEVIRLFQLVGDEE